MVTLPSGSVHPSLLLLHILLNRISQKPGSELKGVAEENVKKSIFCSLPSSCTFQKCTSAWGRVYDNLIYLHAQQK